jgi:uncharacterized protein YdeI (YjbR/CyaY-like superfamily)
MTAPVAVKYFRSAAAFRRWLESNHATARELWVGFYRKDTGRGGITYPEAVDEALCFGWIDGIKKRVDELSYINRFTPRKPNSNWSLVNTRRGAELKKLGRMTPAGLAAFTARRKVRSGAYSFEQQASIFDAVSEREFRAHRPAWDFFQAQPPGYRRLATHWVSSAKRPETVRKRLDLLIANSELQLRVDFLAPNRDPRQS